MHSIKAENSSLSTKVDRLEREMEDKLEEMMDLKSEVNTKISLVL